MTIRRARMHEAALLPAIEESADALFATVADRITLADGAPIAADVHLDAIRAGRVLVAEAGAVPGGLGGFCVLDVVDGDGHIAELSVHADVQRQGLGRALVEAAVGWCRRTGRRALTLTTFRDVAWNAPFYASAGFEPFTDPGPELAAVVAEEAANGLDPSQRLCMRRRVDRDHGQGRDGDGE